MRDLTRRCFAEGAATFFLVFIGVGAVSAESSGVALGALGVSAAFGSVVAAMVYATGHISGAHLNPAVTLAFGVAGGFPAREIAPYVLSQVGGATLAAWLLNQTVGLAGGVGTTVPVVESGAAWTLELLLTFALMFVIAAVAFDRAKAPSAPGIAIGLAVAMGALMGGGFTGGSMNPARSFGPALVTGIWTSHWIYWTAPPCGAILGACFFRAVRSRPG